MIMIVIMVMVMVVAVIMLMFVAALIFIVTEEIINIFDSVQQTVFTFVHISSSSINNQYTVV